MRRHLAIIATASSLLLTSAALAHHSTSAYDYTKTTDFAVTVKEFRWTNPHMFLVVAAPDRNGKMVTWNVECGTPNINVRHGWKKDDLKPGDKVSMSIHPTRDGSPAGTLITVKLADGRTLFGPGNDIVGAPS